jgi:tetratricopeptide (TPR) repeat protein
MNVLRSIQSALEYYQAGDLDKAASLCRKILKRQPHNANVLHLLGIIYYQAQNYDSATRSIRKSLEINPADSEAYYNLGRTFQKLERIDDAIESFQKALQYNPYLVDAYLNLGNIFQEKKELDEAITCYKEAIQKNPNFPGAYYNLGVALQEKEQLDESVSAYQKALDLNPRYADAYHDMGYVLQLKGQLDKAVECYQKALTIKPDLFDAYNNLGRVYQEQGRMDEAIASYQKAIRMNPDFAEAHSNLSMALLLMGKLRQGWTEYEWRWKLEDHSRYDFPQPLWKGSDVSGRTLFLYAEQGFGDTIQFIRYASMAAENGARVIVECQKELKSLVERVNGVEKVITREDPIPGFDFHCPLLSLPMIFDTGLESIPSRIPYLTVDEAFIEKWHKRICTCNRGFKAGLVWSGNPKHKANRIRSCDLATFAPFADLQDVTFYSLQKGEAAKQAKNPPDGLDLVDVMDEVGDFADTAGLIMNLDLIISVDTSVAHLAGALGKPAWILLAFSPDWRWMLDRQDNPWYPTMRLFRQPSPGDWKSVISGVLSQLRSMNRTYSDVSKV